MGTISSKFGRTAILATLAVALFSTSAGGGVYRWTDADGNTHFGDRPPQGTSATDVDMTPTAPYDPEAAAQARARTQRQQHRVDVRNAEYDAEMSKRRQQAEAREAKRRECAHWEDQLGQYRRAQYLYDPLPGGERKILPESERQRAITELEQDIAKHCRHLN